MATVNSEFRKINDNNVYITVDVLKFSFFFAPKRGTIKRKKKSN